MHRITYSLTLKDLFLQNLTIFKIWLIALSIYLFLVTWCVYSKHSIYNFIVYTLSDGIMGPLFLGIFLSICWVSIGLILFGFMAFLMILVSYRRMDHKLRDFTITLSEQSANLTIPKRAFQSDQEAEAFGKAAEQYWKQAKTPIRQNL